MSHMQRTQKEGRTEKDRTEKAGHYLGKPNMVRDAVLPPLVVCAQSWPAVTPLSFWCRDNDGTGSTRLPGRVLEAGEAGG
jgi:hypothetical protein